MCNIFTCIYVNKSVSETGLSVLDLSGSIELIDHLIYYRALKTKGNTPKYGLIFHSTYIGRAGTKNKGRISRYLANKCSIASRIDCFTGTYIVYVHVYMVIPVMPRHMKC